jgi:hypothetical protein
MDEMTTQLAVPRRRQAAAQDDVARLESLSLTLRTRLVPPRP